LIGRDAKRRALKDKIDQEIATEDDDISGDASSEEELS
jgi:hypothetical protein